jgi:primase-polymerase (primpol)-like protein
MTDSTTSSTVESQETATTLGEGSERLERKEVPAALERTTRGYESHSEADLALCSLLAFWTGGDRSRIDRLFGQSGLMREKWDEVHYADDSTYGKKTIERAVAGVSEYYDPEAAKESEFMTEPTGTGGAGQRHAHLAEKNRLLTERVAELETKLDVSNSL